MSVSCSKDYSIKIELPPTYYWKMATIVAGQVLPDIGAVVLNVAAPAYVLAGGLISPNCVATFNGGIGQGIIATPAGAIYLGGLNSFTLRFWVRDAGLADIAGVNWRNRKVPGGFDSTVNSPAAGFIGATFTDSALNDVVAQDIYPADANWHRCVVLCDITAQTLSWKMDDQATVTTVSALPFDFNVPPIQLQFLATGSNLFSYSEIGLWQNKLLSSAELTADWNGGAGKTYP